MKKRISLLVAAVMILSLLPAMGVSAATKNTVVVGGNTVADDHTWVKGNTATSSGDGGTGTPFIQIQNDTTQANLLGSNAFSLTLTNAEWDLGKGVDAAGISRDPISVYGSGGGQGTWTGTVGAQTGWNLATVAGQKVFTGSGTTATTTLAYTMDFLTATVAQVQVQATNGATEGFTLPLPVKLKGVGPAKVTISDVGSTSITPGEYVFATGAGGTTINTIRKSTDTFSGTLAVSEINILETTPGTLKSTTAGKTVEFVAPNGFKWVQPAAGAATPNALFYLGFGGPTNINNSTVAGSFAYGGSASSNDNQVIVFNLGGSGVATSSSTAGAIQFSGLVLERDGKISETPAGDVKVKVNVSDGTSDYLTVGVFATRGVTFTAEDKALPEIMSGFYTSEPLDSDYNRVLDVTIKENSYNAWNNNSTASFVLPSGVKFRGVEVKDSAGINNTSTKVNGAKVYLTAAVDGSNVNKSVTSDGRVTLDHETLTINSFTRAAGTDNVMVKLRCYVTVKPGFTGDITLSSDVDNEAFAGNISAVVGKAIDPFVVKTVQTDVDLGYMNIALGEISIKENKSGALKKTNSTVYTRLGLGAYDSTDFWIGGTNDVYFKEKGKAEVISGDIVIDKVDMTGGVIQLKVKRASSTASEVKLSGMTMDASRSVPEGKLELRVGGLAVANYQTKAATKNEAKYGSFDVEYFVADPAYVNIITAAPNKDTKYTTEVAVTVGSKTIVANGKEHTVDVAPFNSNGYVMVPVRAVSVALGVADNQVMWDGIGKTVTILDTNRGRTSQFTVGKNTVTQNGMVIPFEGPSCANVEGRVFLPFRALGEVVLGCPVAWDQATTTAYFNRSSVPTTTAAPVVTETAPVATTTAQ